MGYILPIQNFQYSDYQNRVIQEKKDHMYIEHPFKALLENKYDEINHTDIKEFELQQEEDDYVRKTKRQIPYGKENLVAEITGKGFLFNDKI